MPLATRRAPGIRFETRAPQPAHVLPRMDVAGFVGFAACGPLDVPVPVQDAAEFEAVFGPDAALAWDPARGVQTYAQLGPAVRAFFGNGGRRCWVVRVASRGAASGGIPAPAAPQRDRFPVGGVVAIDAAGVAQATLAARSAGSWADAVSVTATIDRAPLQVVSVSETALTVVAAKPSDLSPGDLISVTFPGTTWTMLFPVATVTGTSGSPPNPLPQAVELGTGAAMYVRVSTAPSSGAGTVTYLGPRCAAPTVPARLQAGPGAPGTVGVTLAATVADAPPAGSLIQGTFGGATRTIYVQDVELSDDGTGTLVTGIALELTGVTPSPAPWNETPAAVAELLTLSLQTTGGVGGGDQSQSAISGLGFLPDHARFLGALPTDETLYADPTTPPTPGTLAADVTVPRFPLAADPPSPALIYLPLTAGIASPPTLLALLPPGTERARDGLDRLDPSCFLDPDLAGSTIATLLEDAQAIRDLSPAPRPLRGMHALLSIDEVTLVALPDAVQRGWLGIGPEDHTMPATSTEPPAATAPQPDWSQFLACSTLNPSAPLLSLVGGQTSGSFSLSWTATDAPDPAYELEQATLADMSDAVAIYAGPERQFSLYGRPLGATLRFRVRASSGANVGGWSSTLVVSIPAPDRWLTIPLPAYDGVPLLSTQLAALRMCAARGDLLAVLALPEHYRTRAAIAHIQALRASEPGACGYGALYHPWLWVTNPAAPGTVSPAAPDGAASGVIAGRSYDRGPWIAPANQVLTGVVALDPPLPRTDRPALLQDQLNEVRDDAEGFRWLGADTLAEDPDLRPIGVRRLLQALSRYMSLRGAAYVFEPDSDAFRRAVEHDLEDLMTGIWALGAFAGETPSDSFRVSTGSPPNTSAGIDAGRMVAEVAVAPSVPLAFLTVRLTRGADGTLTTRVS